MQQATLKVPLLDLKAQYGPMRDEILAAIARVCDSQQFILGPEVEAFEAEVAAHLGVRHAIGVSSGTDALLVALMALGIGPGDEVITSTYSFFATAGCVHRVGATPVLVDIDPQTYALEPAQVRAAITSRTKAIIPVHLFGLCADMDALVSIARPAGIPVIEDACQAIGAACSGRGAGGIGDLGCFSFFPSKNLGAFGDAGLVTSNDDALADEVRLLRNHGARPKYHHRRVGGNFRLDALQAAVLRVKLRHAAGWESGRRRNARRYDELFEAAGFPASQRPFEPAGRHHVFNQYVVRVPERDRVRAMLADAGIGTEVYYPEPLHLQPCFAQLGMQPGACPHAERAARESLALPVYPELTLDQQRVVADRLVEAVRQAAQA